MQKARTVGIVLAVLLCLAVAPVALGQALPGTVETDTADGVPPGPRPTSPW